jgi:hypothetical protein
MHRLQRLLVLATVSMAGLGGCTGNIDRADEFAQAGVAYTSLMPKALDQSFDLLIAAQSAELASLRTQQVAAGQHRGQAARKLLDRYDAAASERAQILSSLKQQNSLLRAYFKAMARLVENDAATGISASTTSILGSLQTLSPGLQAATIAGKPVASFVEPAVKLAVGAFKSRALQQEIAAHGEDIERILALHAAALKAVKEGAEHDLMVYREQTAELAVAAPFGRTDALPESWSGDRAAYLKGDRRAEAVDEASAASAELHEAWVAFAQADMTDVDLASLLTSIEQLAAFLN